MRCKNSVIMYLCALKHFSPCVPMQSSQYSVMRYSNTTYGLELVGDLNVVEGEGMSVS